MSDVNVFEGPLSAAFGHALRHVAGDETRSVAATATLQELRERLVLPLHEDGLDATEVLRRRWLRGLGVGCWIRWEDGFLGG